MQSKTLMAIGIASAFGLSASAFAGSNHEVITPMSVNETGPVLVSQHDSLGSPQIPTVDVHTGNIGNLELSDATDWSASYEQMAEAGSAGDEYSFMVSWSPATLEGWDYYVIDMQPASDQLSFADEEIDFFMPADELAFGMSDDELAFSSTSDDELALNMSDDDEVAMAEEEVMTEVG